MKVICDANIIVRAAMSRDGPAAAVLAIASSAPHQSICSNALLAEARRILTTERLRHYHGLDDTAIDAFLNGVLTRASFVVVPAIVPAVVPHDPLDDHVIFAAQAAGAEVICTRDTDLHNPVVVAHCAAIGIRVLTDLELLPDLRLQQKP